MIGGGALGMLWSERIYHDLALGWGWSNAGVGLARVFYSFFLGVALGRRFPAGVHRIRLPSWLLAVDVLAVLFNPVYGRLGGFAGLFYVVVLLPLLVVLGAGARERRPRGGALLGDASYAVYAIHYPLIVELSVFVTPKMIAPAAHGPGMIYVALVGVIVGLTALALAIDRFVDRPVRRWLTMRLTEPAPPRRPADCT
jgi:peptidoglycan/LPS O-acetylase OafA/YrhL